MQIKHRHRCCSWKCLFVEQIIYNRKWHLCQLKEAAGEDNGCFMVWSAVGLKVSSPWVGCWFCSPGEAHSSHSLPPCLEDAQSIAKSITLAILVGAFLASPSPRPAFCSLWNILNVEVEILCDNPEILLGITGIQFLRLWNSKEEGIKLWQYRERNFIF